MIFIIIERGLKLGLNIRFLMQYFKIFTYLTIM